MMMTKLYSLPLLLLLAAALVAVTRSVRIHPTLHRRTQGAVNENDDNSSSTGEREALYAPSDPVEHAVKALPLLDPQDFPHSHWAGHLPASASADKYFFYWLFAPDMQSVTHHADADIPLIIWLNGGPGCSSMDGMFLENGPLRFEKENGEYKLKPNEYGWHKTPAFVLYIDQPVGTGLSFTTSGKYPTNDLQVNQDFYFFLQSFLKLHSDKFVYNQGGHDTVRRPLYFSGESHAGHYIPSMMDYILQQNPAAKKSGDAIVVPLAGAAIGNGWTDPFNQYAAADAAYGHGLVGRAQMAALAVKEKACQSELLKGKFSVSICYELLDQVVRQSQGSNSGFKVSQYDARKTEPAHGARTFPPGHKVVEAYLGGWDLSEGGIPADIMPQVLEALHAGAATGAGQRFQECTDPPYDALAHQDGKGVVKELVQVLEHPSNVTVMFFNGMEDLICNHAGNEKFLEVLPWSNRGKWVEAPRYAWKAETAETGKISGYMKEYENLLFLKLLGSGHMVPLDIPNIALDMMRVFTYGGSFETSQQTLKQSKTGGPSCAVCPSCDNTSPASESTGGAFMISYSWFVAVVVAGAFVAILTLFRRKRRVSAGSLANPYDLELHEAQYTDEPEDDDDGDDDEGVAAHEVI